MILYFTGIDGSGKTTLVNDIERRLNEQNIKTLRIWARYTPRFSKIFVNVLKKKTVNNTGNYNTISEPDYTKWQLRKNQFAHNNLVRLTVFTFFFLDYYSQISRVIRKIRKNKNKTILIDRFVIDFLSDQTVNFGDLSGTCIFRWLMKICDSLDMVFFISVKPVVALSRKNDIPGIDYLDVRDRAYRDIIKRLKNGYIIDNNGPQDLAIQEIIKVIQVR
ncbi:MAG: hypothetical protein JXB49_06430 [Bacteroidales bacterium]|nr:hypothetical protein [Bacteroidales bacterium]